MDEGDERAAAIAAKARALGEVQNIIFNAATELAEDVARYVRPGTATGRLGAFARVFDITSALVAERAREQARAPQVAPERFPVDVQSHSFKRWFGESVLVDAKGNPQVFYHGTNADFSRFRKGSRYTSGEGIYFSHDREYASAYGRIIITAHLRMVNPKWLSPDQYVESNRVSEAQFAELKADGFDGVILPGALSEFVVFDPGQIRLIARDPV